MKNLVITLLFLIPFISGCAKIDTNLTINKNKSAQVEVRMLSDKEAKPLEIATMNKNIKRFLDKDYKISDDSTYKKTNVTAVKKVKNITKQDIDLSSLGFESKLESGRFVDVKRNFFVTFYNIHMIYNMPVQKNKVVYVEQLKSSKVVLTPEYLQKYGDASDILLDSAAVTEFDFEQNLEQNFVNKSVLSNVKTKEIDVNDDYKLFDINNLHSRFTITLPSFASYNNATRIENGVYVWDLSKTSPTEIKLQYVVYSGFAIALLFLIGIFSLVYIARRVHRHDTLKRIGNNN